MFVRQLWTKVRIRCTKDGLGTRISNVRKRGLYESRMSKNRGPPVYFEREVPSLFVKSWLRVHNSKVLFWKEQKLQFVSIPDILCSMHDTVRWIVHGPVDMKLFLHTNCLCCFIAMGFHCQSSNVMKTNVIKWCKWPQWIIAVYGRGWNCVPFVVLYCVMQWPKQGIWKPVHPSVCPVGQNEGELWGVIRPDM